MPGADFYDYADKYTTAPISCRTVDERRTRGLQRHDRCVSRLQGQGLARVDFFFEDGSRNTARSRGWLINEINTMPGFTPISMRRCGRPAVGYASLIDRLVGLALQRHARQLRHTRTDH